MMRFGPRSFDTILAWNHENLVDKTQTVAFHVLKRVYWVQEKKKGLQNSICRPLKGQILFPGHLNFFYIKS